MDEHFVEPERIEASISDYDRIRQSEPDNYKVWNKCHQEGKSSALQETERFI